MQVLTSIFKSGNIFVVTQPCSQSTSLFFLKSIWKEGENRDGIVNMCSSKALHNEAKIFVVFQFLYASISRDSFKCEQSLLTLFVCYLFFVWFFLKNWKIFENNMLFSDNGVYGFLGSYLDFHIPQFHKIFRPR